MHVQSCCFADKTNCFLKLALWSLSQLLKLPIIVVNIENNIAKMLQKPYCLLAMITSISDIQNLHSNLNKFPHEKD